MAEKRKDITQGICDQVQFLIKGGATNKKAGAFVGLSATTISRIRTAGYSAEEFRKNNEARREEEKKTLTDYISKEAIESVKPHYVEDKKHPGTYHLQLTRSDDYAPKNNDQVPGQMAMELPTYPQVKETDLNKLLRFLAGKTDLLGAQLSKYDRYMREMGIQLCGIGTKLDKLNDNLCQILRRMDK